MVSRNTEVSSLFLQNGYKQIKTCDADPIRRTSMATNSAHLAPGLGDIAQSGVSRVNEISQNQRVNEWPMACIPEWRA